MTQHSQTLVFEDNRQLKALCGEHDSHLALLEKAFNIRIDMRGNQIILTGNLDQSASLADLLNGLYDRLSQQDSLTKADIEAAIRFAQMDTESPPHLPDNANMLSLQKRMVTPRSAAQSTYLDAMEKNELVFGVGPAGTGKTYLAVAYAANLLIRGDVERIILSRPAIEAGERIGFLPGDMKEKVDPYLRPLYDALYDVLHTDFVNRRLATGDIEIAPLAFMRGRTLSRAAIILDEAQNATVAQMKMFLTRLGEGSRMIVTGDPSQSDLPRGDVSGLGDALALLNGVKSVGISHFSAKDVVRHKLVARIVSAYDRRDKGQSAHG